MQVDRPVAHADTIERLWRAARAERLPHALLFEGPAGIGKYTAAKWFAMGCLCASGPGEPCGSCPACKQVRSGAARSNHPDLFVLDPDDPELAPDFERGQAWRVHRIAYRPEGSVHDPEYCLENAVGLRTLEGGRRVILVREAQRMNEAAQNALLKTLEEPRPGTVLVLETERGAQLLSTIKSRCIRIRFEPLDLEECARVLVAAGRAPEVARELARLSCGAPGRALEQEKTRLLELRAALGDAALGRGSALAAARRIQESDGAFEGGTPTARERARARAVGELAQALLLDGLRLTAGVAAQDLVHGALAEELAALGERELRRRLGALGLALADLSRNLAPAPVLERMLLILAHGPSAPMRLTDSRD